MNHQSRASDAELKNLCSEAGIQFEEALQVLTLVEKELDIKPEHIPAVLKIIAAANVLRNMYQYKDPPRYYEYGRCIAVARTVTAFLRKEIL